MQLWDATGSVPLPTGCLTDRLARDGLVLLRQATAASVQRLLDGWTDAFGHPHEDAPGQTVVTPRLYAAGHGTAGFTTGALEPHTDRSLSLRPPSVLASVLHSPADRGGEALVADGVNVLTALRQRMPSTLIARLQLGTPHGDVASVVTFRGGLVQLRYRDDDVASPTTGEGEFGEAVAALRACVAAATRTLPLESGDGYILHNHRYLHGRTSFTGNRTLVRMLATVVRGEYLWLNRGFCLADT